MNAAVVSAATWAEMPNAHLGPSTADRESWHGESSGKPREALNKIRDRFRAVGERPQYYCGAKVKSRLRRWGNYCIAASCNKHVLGHVDPLDLSTP